MWTKNEEQYLRKNFHEKVYSDISTKLNKSVPAIKAKAKRMGLSLSSSEKCSRQKRGKTHGKYGTKIYRVWECMKARCNNENNTSYPNYGGRGITVCKRWDLFQNFYSDMGDVPFPGAQIDRVDNDGNYEPGNCRWVTGTQNAQNSRNVKLSPGVVRMIRNMRADGATYTQLAKIHGVSTTLIREVCNYKAWANIA